MPEVPLLLLTMRDYQWLIGGICTLIAAIIAFFAILRPAKHNAKLEQRAVARALWAELAGLGARVFSDIEKIRDDRLDRIFKPHLPVPLNFAIFEANPAVVGRLPPDAAFMVVTVYKMLLDLNDRYTAYRSSKDLVDTTGAKGFDIAEHAESVLDQIGVVLRGTYKTAGLARRKANAALTPWTSPIAVWKTH